VEGRRDEHGGQGADITATLYYQTSLMSGYVAVR